MSVELTISGHNVVIRRGDGGSRVVSIDGEDIFQVGLFCDPIFVFEKIKEWMGDLDP